jgi:hypothetical protein
MSGFGGDPEVLVEGDSAGPWSLQYDIIGHYIRFQLWTPKLITEATWIQSGHGGPQGTWQWQGSDDGTNWTNIGAQFILGEENTQIITELSVNADAWLYYQLIGISGYGDIGTLVYQMQFKIGDPVTGYGQLTQNAPTTIGQYVVVVGTAVSSTTLDVEILTPILL